MAIDVNASSWTSTQLLAAVRLKAQLPAASVDWTDAVLLREASEAIWSFAGWALDKSGDGRLSFSFDRSVVAALSGPYRAATEFLLPSQALGDTIQNVVWVDASGQREHPLTLIGVHEQANYDSGSDTGDPRMYALLDGRIRVYPQPSSGGVIRFNYRRRHPELVADTTTNAPTIVSVSDAGSGYTAFALGSSSPFAVGDYVDLVNSQYPYRILFADLYCGASVASSASLYVPHSYVAALGSVAGMRLVKAGASPFVHLPLELRTCLAAKIAANILGPLGDTAMASGLEGQAREEISRFLQLANPRTKADRMKVVNPYSILRGRMRTRRFGGNETW